MSIILAILAVLAGVIYVAAIQQDLSRRLIPNFLSVAIFMIGVLKWALIGDPSMAMWAFIVAAVVFIVTFGMFAIGWMGGGDVKLLAASSFLVGAWATYPFLVYTALAGGIVTLAVIVQMARVRWNRSIDGAGDDKAVSASRITVPYGVAISIGAMWILAQQSLLGQQTLLR